MIRTKIDNKYKYNSPLKTNKVANSQPVTSRQQGFYNGVEWSHPDDYEKIEQPNNKPIGIILTLEHGKPLNVKEIETYLNRYTTPAKPKAYLLTQKQFSAFNKLSFQYHIKKANYYKSFFLPLQLFYTKIASNLQDKHKLTHSQFKLLICILTFQAITKKDVLNLVEFRAFLVSITESDTITLKLNSLVSDGLIIRLSRESIQLSESAQTLHLSLVRQLTIHYNKYIDNLANYFDPESL